MVPDHGSALEASAIPAYSRRLRRRNHVISAGLVVISAAATTHRPLLVMKGSPRFESGHRLLVDFEGFARAIHALGGVRRPRSVHVFVCVRERVKQSACV